MKLEGVKPKIKNKSDKYSINLYKLLKKESSQREVGKYVWKQLRIYWIKNSRWDGSPVEFDPSKPLNTMQMLISPFGGSIGYLMSSVLRDGRNEQFSFSYREDELIDITDWFFDRYEQIGRCIFDLNHNRWWRGDENRFTHVNNTRKCNWCGEWQKKEIEKRVKIERIEVWKSDKE